MAPILDPELEQIAKAIGRKLKELADNSERKLTTRQVADAIGASSGIVSLWYRGKRMPRMENMFALAKLHGVTLGELYEYVPGMARTDAQMRVYRVMNRLAEDQQNQLANGLEAAAGVRRTPSITKL